jgi:hypothetical protein
LTSQDAARRPHGIAPAHAPPADDVRAGFERREQPRNLLGRILQIRVERHDDLAAGTLHAREQRGMLAVVASEPDHPHGRVAGAERAKDLRRVVAAPVVHEDDLVRAADLLERAREPLMERDETLRLVEHGDHDRQRRPRAVAHRALSRTSRQSLWPPKPNEFEMAARIRAATAVLGT